MKKIDIMSIAFGNFRRRKTRSILTVLGVVIGVASIVVMVSLGIAVNVSFDEQIKQMGDITTIRVNPGFDQSTGQQKGKLDDELVAQLEQIDKVTVVSPEIRLNGKMASGKYLSYANITGVKAEYLEKLGFKTQQGSLEGFADSSGKNIFCLMGSEVGYDFQKPRRGNSGGSVMFSTGMSMGGSGEEVRPAPDIDVMDEKSKIKFTFDYSYGESNPGDFNGNAKKPVLYNMKPIGLLQQEYSEKGYGVFIDIETAKRLKKEQEKQQQSDMPGTPKKKTEQTYDTIKVLTESIDDTIRVTDEIKALGYEAYSSAEVINTFKNTAQLMQLILGGIGGISLLVAAIGITNTMIMSIYERTREIGIMKVIGCQLKDIRSMFLFEAGFIGLFGGAIGLAISYGISYLLNIIGKNGMGDAGGMGGMMGMGGGSTLSVVPVWLAVLAVVFAILVGLVSGFLPARRAMRLSALEAMRT